MCIFVIEHKFYMGKDTLNSNNYTLPSISDLTYTQLRHNQMG